LDDLGPSRHLLLRPLVIVATSSPEIQVLQNKNIATPFPPSDCQCLDTTCSLSSFSSDSSLAHTLSPLLILPNHRQQKNDSKRDGLDPTYFPNNVFDSSCSDNDKENVHPRLRIFPKTKCNMSKVHGQHCPETTTASNHRRVSYDRLPCLEKIGKDALFDASNNATTNESKTEVSL
jgi:hypothetical protein